MERYGHTVKLRKPKEEEYKLAELIGLKYIDEYGDVYYKSFDGVGSTLFTSPPAFCVDAWIKPLIEWANERYIEIVNKNNAQKLVKELIEKLQ